MDEAVKHLIRDHFRNMDGYVSAGMESDKKAEKIFMNANENPFALPGLDGCNYYPEPQPTALVHALAALYGVSQDQLIVTRGADESIVLITKLFCEPHKDAILICPPTFGMYAVNADSTPAEIVKVPLIARENSYQLDTERVIDTVLKSDGKIKLVYLCSPNNPTGESIPKDTIIHVCDALKGNAMVVLDEAYAEFSEQGSLAPALNDHTNLLILRTLSKAYALAGVRIGATLSGDTDLMQLIKAKLLDAYPIPGPCIAAAMTALSPENLALAKENIATLLNERDRIKAHLEASELVETIYHTNANFIFFKMPQAHEFWQYCLDHNFILRDFSKRKGTEHCLRVSPSLPEANDKFLALFDSFMSIE